MEIILTISVLPLWLLPKLLIIWPNNIVIRGMPNPLAMAPTVPTIINATSVESANEKERKRTGLIAIRNFDIYIYIYKPQFINEKISKFFIKNKNNAEVEKSSNIDGVEKTQTVPLLKLFSFADSIDVALMIVGTVGAIASGLGMPLMTILFGQMINSFGNKQSSNTNFVCIISKVFFFFFFFFI